MSIDELRKLLLEVSCARLTGWERQDFLDECGNPFGRTWLWIEEELQSLIARVETYSAFARLDGRSSFYREGLLEIVDTWAGRRPARSPIEPRSARSAPQTLRTPRRVSLDLEGGEAVSRESGTGNGARLPERRPIKREALIDRVSRDWPSVERDLKDAHRNGLSAARLPNRFGWWDEVAACSWAKERGKWHESMPLPVLTHRMRG